MARTLGANVPTPKQEVCRLIGFAISFEMDFSRGTLFEHLSAHLPTASSMKAFHRGPGKAKQLLAEGCPGLAPVQKRRKGDKGGLPEVAFLKLGTIFRFA